MADIREAITAVLLADGTVSGLIGVRARWQKLEQNETMPAVRLAMLPGHGKWAMGDAPDHYWRRFQADCYADSRGGAVALATAVDGALNNYSGTSEAIVIQHIELETGTGQPFDEPTESHRVMLRGIVKYDG